MALDYEKAFVVDKNFVIRDVNCLNDNFEYDPQSEQRLLGFNCFELFYGRSQPCPDCPVPKALKSNRSVESRITNLSLHAPGARIATALPLMAENGISCQAVVDCLDEEHLEHLHNLRSSDNPFIPSLYASYRYSTEPGKAETDVAAVTAQIAHKVNNHLSVIMGILESEAGADTLDKDDNKFLTRQLIHEHLLQIVDYFYRIQLPKPFKQSECDFYNLEEIVEAAVNSVKLLYPQKNVQLHFFASKPMPLCFCNEFQISLATTQLLKNAFEAIEESGDIGVSLRHDSMLDIFRITINDNGTGINPDDLGRIFEPFFTTRKKFGAVGMGLTATARVIRFHGGKIRMSSEPNIGTSVLVELPATLPVKMADG